jgi:aminotransferase
MRSRATFPCALLIGLSIRDELRAAFSEKTKAIIVLQSRITLPESLHRDEMEYIASSARSLTRFAYWTRFTNTFCIRVKAPSSSNISMAQIDGMRDRTVVVNSMSKTYSVTGWRVGYCIAPPEITSGIRKVHDFLTVGAAHPLQAAGAYALSLPVEYYEKLEGEYRARRDLLLPCFRKTALERCT